MEFNSWNNAPRRAWNTPWNIRKSEHARRKPDGGFCFIPAMALIRAWSAYKGMKIRLYDLRVWLACFEAVARRCDVTPNRFPRYTKGEIHRLVGGRDPGNVQTAFRRLSKAGLLDWSECLIRFPAGLSKVDAGTDLDLQRMIDLVVNHRRKVPVPRRTLRFLADISRPVTIATVLGHLLRCLYYRNGMCQPEGRCKASWIAEVFGVDVRNVKLARTELGAMGWLMTQCSSQPAKNRWGAAVRINLSWAREAMSPSDGSPPPRSILRGESPPPGINRKLSSRSEDQKPVHTVRTGACALAAPNLRNIRSEDLGDLHRLDLLLVEARRRNLLPAGEAARLRFFAAAAHAMRVGRCNPPGLFISVIRRGLWSFIAATDEDAARKLCFQRSPALVRRASLPAGSIGPSQNSSLDSMRLTVSHVLRNLGIHTNQHIVARAERFEPPAERSG